LVWFETILFSVDSFIWDETIKIPDSLFFMDTISGIDSVHKHDTIIHMIHSHSMIL
jgi:hypothetical protein